MAEGFVNGLLHAPVMMTYPTYEDHAITADGTFRVPRGAKRVSISCIGASGGTTPKWQRVGTAGGGAGYMSNVFNLAVTPGQTFTVVVGKGGAVGHGPTHTGGAPTPGTDGGASSVTRDGVVLASAAGSRHGDPGYTLASGIQVAGVGTDGSAGSGGGGGYTGAGGEYTWEAGKGGNGVGTTGGARGGGWASGGGGGGSYKGENGKEGGIWGGAAAPAVGTSNANEYYCLNDSSTGHYLEAVGGDGSVGTAETYGTPKGGPGGRMGATCSGTGHGRGANAGDAGSNGFVLIRVHFK